MNQLDTDRTNLAHHFSDAEQQHDAAKFGMWIFILSELLLFGGLFVAYTVFRVLNPEMFYNAHKALNVTLGTLNTIILITSSLTIALAIHFMQLGQKSKTLVSLYCTLALAAAFLVIKFFEYSHKFELGQLPGKFYTYTGIKGNNPHIFFSIYFVMTGLHALHIIGGMVVISLMIYKTSKNLFSSAYYTPLELTGLYWHLVDIIWIFLFPPPLPGRMSAAMNNNTKTDNGHITPLKVYLLVGAMLLILTALTVKVSTIHLGPWNAIVALAIASTKALLVALFFMHLLYDRKMYAVVVSSALVFLGILIGLTMADVLRRGDINEYEAAPIKSEAPYFSKQKADTTAIKSESAPNDTASPNDGK